MFSVCRCTSDGEPCRCFGGPSCAFHPCECLNTEGEEIRWRCSDICCCECNYKEPAWMPHALSSTHTGPPQRELMQEISRLSQSGFRLQLVGPEGEIRTLEHPLDTRSSHAAVASVRSTPVLSLQNSPVASPGRHISNRRLSLQSLESINRGQYVRTKDSGSRVHFADSWRPVTPAQTRVLPSIPDDIKK